MKDYFKEQLVKKEYTKQDGKKRIIILVISAVVLYFLWNVVESVAILNPDYYYSLMLLLVVFAALIVLYDVRLINNLNKEFEYAYTSSNLDIDVIINKKRRKTVFSGCTEEFEIMAPYGDTQHLAMYDGLKTKDFSSGVIKENTYVFVTVYKGKKMKFIFEPCPEIVRAIKTDLSSRRLFISK